MIHWVKAVLLSLGPNCLFDYLVNYVSCTHLSMNCSLFVIEIAKQAASLAVMWPGDRKLMLSRQKCVSPKCEIGYLSNPVLLTHIQFLEKGYGNHRISAFCHAFLGSHESNSFPKIVSHYSYITSCNTYHHFFIFAKDFFHFVQVTFESVASFLDVVIVPTMHYSQLSWLYYPDG